MRQVFDRNGVAYPLGDKIAAGGQGEVFPMASMPSRVVKIFLPKFLTGEEGKNLRGKLAALRGKQRRVRTAAVGGRGDFQGRGLITDSRKPRGNLPGLAGSRKRVTSSCLPSRSMRSEYSGRGWVSAIFRIS